MTQDVKNREKIIKMEDIKVCRFDKQTDKNGNYIEIINFNDEVNEEDFAPSTLTEEKPTAEFILRGGNIINQLPEKYKEKVLNGEYFSIKITSEKIITFNK